MVSTRLFFGILFMSIALAGCQGLAAPWLAERPTPTPTPLPPAEETALSFLQAWEKEDYTAMYALLTPTAQKRSSRADFEERYHAALIEATVTAVRTRLNSLLQDGTRAEATYHQTWETALFQPIEADNRLLLRFEMGRWGVDWSSTNILPVLGAGVTLRRLGEPLPRGNIYDRSGLGLAVQGTAVTLGVVPAQIADETTLLGQLARITGLSASAIRQKYINAPPNWFVPIADISFETSQANDGILGTLVGVERRARYVRLYPGGMLAAHLLGYMGYIPKEELSVWQTRGYRGDELVGRSGIEGWGEVYLAGQRGARLVAFAQDGRELAQFGERPPTPSKSLYLTIDRRLQQAAEAALGERRGAVVVLDPNNGEVLALASYPRFDPNHLAVGISSAEWAAFSQDPAHPLVNRATQGIYPPGSVFKIVTMAAALEKGGMTPETTFECTGTWEGLGKGFVKTCWLPTGHGTLDLVTALTVSCDVTFYEVGKRLYALDPNLLPSYARAFGLGSLTGLEGVSEVAGMVPDDAWKRSTLGEPWYPGDGVNLAVGQGYLLVTPLQMANILAAVGNGGTLYRPRLIARIGDAPGTTTQLEEAEGEFGPQVLGKLPVSPEHLAAIQRGLAGVTGGQRGTARAAFVGVSFTSAGKTGTAESGGKEPHSWFVGYAPAENPRVAVAVVVENGGEGATVAAPIFRQVVEAFFAMF